MVVITVSSVDPTWVRLGNELAPLEDYDSQALIEHVRVLRPDRGPRNDPECTEVQLSAM